MAGFCPQMSAGAKSELRDQPRGWGWEVLSEEREREEVSFSSGLPWEKPWGGGWRQNNGQGLFGSRKFPTDL